MRLLGASLAAGVRVLVRLLLAVYFRRVELFRAERVTSSGPVVFASNHPGSLSDAFIVGTSIPRRVHFVGTVQLFGFAPIAWLLRQCGVIPINRRQDDPAKMKSVSATFEACFTVLEQGGAIGIFPEGATYDDSQLKEVKTGTARLTLELEDRHDGQLGLQIVPVGLTYSAKDRYRSDVIVHFGEPIAVAAWLLAYRADARCAVRALSAELEMRLRSLILDVPTLEHARIVAAIRRLYLDRLRVGQTIVGSVSDHTDGLVLTQAIQRAVAYYEEHRPAQLASFLGDLDRYERRLARLRLSDDTVLALSKSRGATRYLLVAAALVLGAPLAAYGAVHRWLPLRLVRVTVERLTRQKTRLAQTPHATMLAGLVAFGGCYAVYAGIAYWRYGAWVAFGYALSLPLSGLVAHTYTTMLRRYGGRLRTASILLRAPLARRTIAKSRMRLVARLGVLRREYERILASAPEKPV